jgi:hypothetical protein
LLFVLGFLLSWLILPKLQIEIENENFPKFEGHLDFSFPDGGEYILAGYRGIYIETRILWHGIGDSIENAKNADILFLGNSRVQLGLRRQYIMPLAEKDGLNIFFLASAPVETGRFFLEIIKKFDLRPKLVVCNVDNTFFSGQHSEIAEEVVKISRTQAYRTCAEDIFIGELRLRMHRVLPRISSDERNILGPRDGLHYRSTQTGCWWSALEPQITIPIIYDSKEREIDTEQEQFALELKRELEARGARLILMVVPNSESYRVQAEYLAELLQVPLIAPRPARLYGFDETHLKPASSKRFTDCFWERFVDLDEVRALVAPQRTGLTSHEPVDTPAERWE